MITYGAIKSGEQMVRVGGDVRDLDIHLPDIRPDQSAQPRENLHNDRIAEYAESMKAGDQFPPLTVFHDGEVYWLADGFHRFYAAQHAGRKHIRCYVRQGGLRDAILYSVGANAKHGLARSDADKERAVLRLLNDAEWSTWTDRDIAKRCFVSHPFVAKVRKAHAGVTGNVSSERTYTTKHGTTATMKTAGINASRKNAREALVSDEPSPEAGPQAEASLVGTDTGTLADCEGRHEGEVTSVDLPTNQQETAEEPGAGSQPVPSEGSSPRANVSIGVTGGESAAAKSDDAPARNIFDELVSLWKEADAGVRQDFKAYITGSEFVAKFNHTEGNPAPGTGVTDVDRSAERASSAVEVGATNSPDGATDIGIPIQTGNDTTLAAREADESAAPNSNPQPKTPGDADKAEAETPPTVSANPFIALSRVDQVLLIRPHCQHPGTEQCAGSGRNHCHACKRLMAESEAA